MCINSVSYPGCYAPRMIENHTNPQAKAIEEKLNDEISFKQAYIKVEFLKNTLERHHELSKPERTKVEYMLHNAQYELAQIQQKLDKKYPV